MGDAKAVSGFGERRAAPTPLAMLAAGIDAGAKTVKVVIVRDGAVVAKRLGPAGLDLGAVAENLLKEAIAEIGATDAGITWNDLAKIVVTGAGGTSVHFATNKATVTRVMALAGARLDGSVRTVIDIGAEESRAIRLDGRGNIEDFALNDKCAAGAGSFIEAMSRALEVRLEDLGPLALTTDRAVGMNAQCVIFAESEVVSLIHQKTPPAEIARAAYEAMANRVFALLKRLGVNPPVMVVGGVARDPGFLDALKRRLNTDIVVPPDPEYAGAFGAALSAQAEPKAPPGPALPGLP
jgi:benzoyl-CoA reductase subunit D